MAGTGKAYLDTNRADRNMGFTKRGSVIDGTDGAHRLSHRVTVAALEHSPGRAGYGTGPTTDARAMCLALNDDDNIRMKTSYGNRTLDERRDVRIAASIASGESLTQHTTAMRAVQAYKGALTCAEKSSSFDQVVARLGDLTFNDGKPGRPRMIKNML
eukprot:m.7889 g.7889  ORF g.7889 m.7889 type:complete len:158 (-) comp8968_c0_seq1:38-511(-)